MKITPLVLIGFSLLGCSDTQHDTTAPSSRRKTMDTVTAVTRSEGLVKPVKKNENNTQLPALEASARNVNNFTHSYNAVAKKLSGVATDNPEYSTFIKTKWEKLCNDSLGAIEEWSRKNVIPNIGDFHTVFYPFGGPDIASPLKFFPNANTYILVGLEPIEHFAEIDRNADRPEMQESLKNAFSWYLQKGFFVTSEMSRKLSSKFLHGTMCLILPQLALLEFSIDNVEDISIDANGNELPRANGMLNGAKITCSKESDKSQKIIYYIRANLSNSNARLANLTSFMDRRTFITFIKSASYALHDHTLSKFKHFLLRHSKAIFQDDTGIPFGDFNNEWEKYAFGIYTEPVLRIFKNYKQQSMLNFFKTKSIVNIPFKIGYGFNQGRPNLLLTVRRNPIASNIVVHPHVTETSVIKPKVEITEEKCRLFTKNTDNNNISADRTTSLQLEVDKLFGIEYKTTITDEDYSTINENLFNILLLPPLAYDNAYNSK
jgi:hypothetical protein